MRAQTQSGAILLLMLIFLLLGSLAWFVAATPSPRREFVTAENLAMAKEALLGYAVLYPDARDIRQGFVPGHLPCPDTDRDKDGALDYEGTEASTCETKGISALGHFPWRSLNVPPLRDDAMECLWYLVSGNHKATPKADLLNPDTAGLIEIVSADGNVIAEQVVAVLFAPGATLPGQARQYRVSKDGKESECRRDYDASQYLENNAPNPAAEGITRVVVGNSEMTNDKLVWITREEWSARIGARLPPEVFFAEEDMPDMPQIAQRIAACVMEFGEINKLRRLPWAAPLQLTAKAPETFQFSKLTDQQNLLGGRTPYSVSRSVKAIGAGNFVTDPPKICKEKTEDGKEIDGKDAAHPSCRYQDCAVKSDATNSSCRLLIREKCPDFMAVDGRPDSGVYNSHNGWWDKWKDHFFYVVSPNFAPAATEAADCETAPDGCLRVAGKLYAAAVIFAGDALPEQKRAGEDRMDAAQYLEGENAISVQHGGKTLAIAGNDQISCIEAGADGFILIANCGRQDCRNETKTWLTCQEKGGQCASPDAFSGCACYGVARAWQDANCVFASPRPLCRRLLARMRSCA